MNSTLKLISIQHELGMSIGVDLRLKPMLQHFSRVCIRRLGLAGIHYYFPGDDSGNPALADGKEVTTLHHYLSLPNSNSEDILDHKECEYLLEQYRPEERINCTATEKDNEFIYCFQLVGLGIVVIRRINQPINEQIQLLLKPIFARLAISCRASIEHEYLLHAVAGRKQAEETILFRLDHDDLTELPNRRLLKGRLEQELSRCRRHHAFGALLFIDLDRFKSVNDTLGHAVGDKLLIAVADILVDVLRREDTVARVGGDEFVILLTDLGESRELAVRNVQVVIDKIYALFSTPLYDDDHTYHVTLSIGVEIFPENNKTAGDILRHADIAMYQAKAGGRNSALFYSREMSIEQRNRLALEREMKDAIKNREFELYYQPQIHFTRGLIGAEALLRWNNPKRGFVSPAQFIPIAEESGLILDIGDWVLHTACEQIHQMEGKGLPPGFEKVSVNVSAIQLDKADFVDKVLCIIREASIQPGLLGIELTEASLVEHIEDTVYKMKTLVNSDVHLSIDDFGTGYSSLAYLSRFPVGTLKIDQAFVRGLHVDDSKRTIVAAIMALGQGLDLSIIAEGVETKEELDCLRSAGCENYQGYYFGHPVPFEDFQALVCSDSVATTRNLKALFRKKTG